MRLITDHRDLLDEIAHKLLDDEVIDHDEIAAIMAGHRDTGAARRSRAASPTDGRRNGADVAAAAAGGRSGAAVEHRRPRHGRRPGPRPAPQ